MCYKEPEREPEWIRLPCKLGDTMYFITDRVIPRRAGRKTKKRVIEAKVMEISIRKPGMFITLFLRSSRREVACDKVGEILFFTKEEAEQKLTQKD